ncbi:hypothetical protein QOV31_005253 (plasmid) [Agrobacterium fabrum]|nr:hypothetical protein QOV31_005253 [Agrobacterium fabrum]
MGFVGDYSGVKSIHSNPSNARYKEPTSHIDVVLRNRFTGRRLFSVDGVAISERRTGWLALACLNLLLQGRSQINVFLFGAGKVAEAIILALNSGASGRIQRIAILSRCNQSNHELVQRLQPEVKISLKAVNNRAYLSKSKFIITATNSNKPVFEMKEITDNAVTLTLGIDELPADYFDHVLKLSGIVVADDMDAMETRNIDSLALHYSRRHLKLTKHGRDNGIRNYSEVLRDPVLMQRLISWNGPANFSAVGLASYDLAVAVHLYEKLAKTVVQKYVDHAASVLLAD